MRNAPGRELGFRKAAAKKRPKGWVVILNADGTVSQKQDRRNPLARSRIMYVENKSERLNNRGRIGRVWFSKTGKTLYYDWRTFQSLKGSYKSNYFDIETKEEYWISGPKRDGGDRLYGTRGVDIDDDVREEYWRDIRKQPSRDKERVA